MEGRSIAGLISAGFLGVGLTAAATGAEAKSPRTIVVEAVNPDLQRRVSYADLDLTVKPDQKLLKHRISTTAEDLCFDLNGSPYAGSCHSDALASTRDQVAAAIYRAERKMAGYAVGPAIAISMVIGNR